MKNIPALINLLESNRADNIKEALLALDEQIRKETEAKERRRREEAEIKRQRQAEEAARKSADKLSQVGTGDRSERIRTYNFPQNRVTDHRYNISCFDLPAVMEGEFGRVIDPILAADSEIRFEALQK